MECSSRTEKRSTYLMFMLCLNEIIDKLALANSVRWFGYVLRREDVHILRAFDFVVEGQRRKGMSKRTWTKQVEDESVKVGLRRENSLCGSKWSVGLNVFAAGLR